MTTWFPTLHTVAVRRFLGESESERGTRIRNWGDPVDVDVYSVSPTEHTEPLTPGRDVLVDRLTVLAPPGAPIGPHDRLEWAGATWEVDGDVADWNTGPFSQGTQQPWQPGVSITVRRVRG